MSHINYFLDWCVGTFVIHDGRVLLCHHRNMNMWLPPGGHIEPGELPVTAAIRETREETGLGVTLVPGPGDLVPVADTDKFCGVMRPRYMDKHFIRGEHWHLGLAYFARLRPKYTPADTKLDHGEHIAFVWATSEEVDGLEPMTEQMRFYAKEAIRLLA